MSEEENGAYGPRTPTNDLDASMMLNNPVWGQKEVSPELYKTLSNYKVLLDNKGKAVRDPTSNQVMVQEQSLWSLLGVFTRDMRLANLSPFLGELEACRFYIILGTDLLECGMYNSFIVAMNRNATIMETSQSKGGFLRKQLNTLRNEISKKEEQPNKKSYFGRSNDEGGF